MTKKTHIIRLGGIFLGVAALAVGGIHYTRTDTGLVRFVDDPSHLINDPGAQPLAVNPDAGFSPIDVPEFEVASSHGGTLTRDGLKGTYSVIYFGFAYCPDVCINATDGMARAYDLLTDDEKKNVRMYFFSFDMERDTPEFLKTHLSAFNEDFIGASGAGPFKLDMVNVLREFDIVADRVKRREGFSFSHSNYTYLLDREARFLTQYNYTTITESPESLVRDLRALWQKEG
jgi:protein SCO1/2